MKNAFDWVYSEWGQKAIGFVGYGSTGGARAIEHMRLIAIELQMAPVRHAVHLPVDLYLSMMKEEAPVDPALFAPVQKAADTHDRPTRLVGGRAQGGARQGHDGQGGLTLLPAAGGGRDWSRQTKALFSHLRRPTCLSGESAWRHTDPSSRTAAVRCAGARTGSPNPVRRPRAPSSWRRRSWPRRWPSSTAQWSTSRCRRSSGGSTPISPPCNGC